MSIDFGTDIYEEPIVAKTFLSEDAQEGSLRPKTLSEYIGQEKAKGNLAVFIAAAKKRGESLDHVLLHGPPGLGKTTLAGIIAQEMGVNIRITSGPAIEKAGDPWIQTINYIPVKRAADTDGIAWIAETDNARGIFIIIFRTVKTVHPFSIQAIVFFFVYIKRIILL